MTGRRLSMQVRIIFFLDQRDSLGGNFHGQVPPGHHDSVGAIQNFLQIFDSLAVFDLGDDLDGGFLAVQNSLYSEDVLLVPDEGMCDEIQVVIGGELDETFVLFA